MKIIDVPHCGVCPWIWWDDDICACHHPDTLDRIITDETSTPDWCMLDELESVDIEEDDD